jgi:hypothetical protein
MVAKKADADPEAHPHLFLRFFKLPIHGRKRKIGIRILNIVTGTALDPELKRVARKATKHFLGKKTELKKREIFRKKCLKKLRAMRLREIKKDNPIEERVRG